MHASFARLGHRLLGAASLAVALLASAATRGQEPAVLQAALTLQQQAVEAIARAEKSVVAIARVRVRDESLWLPGNPRIDPQSPDFVPNEYASGVVVDARGLVLTTYHALGDPDQNAYFVSANRRSYPARVKAADPWMDLAVLEVDGLKLEPVAFGDASQLRKGQFVFVLGNPYGIARHGEVSASWGIIANLERQAPRVAEQSRAQLGKETLHHYGTLIQTDARLNLGTSGGALIDLRGQMIGLTTALAAQAGYEQPAGFAIPVDEAFQRTLEALKAGRRAEYGFLGVGPEPRSLNSRRKGSSGAVIADVIPGTPARRANLRRGDVIVAIDGQPVRDEVDLIRRLGATHAGHQVQLEVERGGRRMNQSVMLSKKYLNTVRPAIAAEPEPRWRGLQVEYATAMPKFPEQSLQFELGQCVGVIDVEADSPAWKAGLRPEMYVRRVAGRAVTTPAEFAAAVADQPGVVRLEVIRAGGSTTLRVEPQ